MSQAPTSSDSAGADMQPDASPVDILRVVRTLGRTWSVLVLFLVVGCSLAYVFIRYTLPVYQSQSTIRINSDQQNTSILNIKNFFNSINYNAQDADISLLHTNLFLSKVVQNLNYPVSYYKNGNILNSEMYGNSPISVHYSDTALKQPNTFFSLRILDKNRFKVNLQKAKKVIGTFGEIIHVNGQTMRIEKTAYFVPKGRYFFKLNTEDALIEYLKEHMIARIINKTVTTIQINFEDYNPYKAKHMLFVLDSTYMVFLFDLQSGILRRGLSFVQKQLAAVEKSIHQRENYFEDFVLQEKTTNVGEELRISIKILNELDARIRSQRQQIDYLDTLQQHANGEALLTENPAYKLPDELITAITEFNTVSEEKRSSAISYKAGSYVLILHAQRLMLMRNKVKEHARTYRSFLADDLQHSLLEKTRVEEKIERLPALGNKYQKNKRLYALDEQFYLSLIRKKVELEVAQASSRAEAVLLSSPHLPLVPISPNSTIYYGGAIMGALALYMAFCVLYYLLHNDIQQQQTLRRLTGHAVLGSLPHCAKLQIGMADTLPRQHFCKSLLSIKGSVEFFGLNKQCKLLMISSTLEKEGKTAVSFYLADLFAKQGIRTLFIDLNLQRPSVYTLLKKQAPEGMSRLLKGDSPLDRMIYCPPKWAFDYLNLGIRPIDPMRLVTHPRFDSLLQACKARYDVLLMDTAPVYTHEMSNLVLARKADFLLYLAHARLLKARHIPLLRHFLSASKKEDKMGLVLNAQLPAQHAREHL